MEKIDKSKTGLIIFTIVFLIVAFNPRRTAVLAIIAGGLFVSPEASEILYHYCFGNGDTLYLKPDYFQLSPVIRKAKVDMRPVQEKIVWVHQPDDRRLSYALNGFTLCCEKDNYMVHQYIQFYTKGKVFNQLNLGFTTIKEYDNLIHAFDCTPYMAVATIQRNSL